MTDLEKQSSVKDQVVDQIWDTMYNRITHPMTHQSWEQVNAQAFHGLQPLRTITPDQMHSIVKRNCSSEWKLFDK
jgi:hypothetical protein